MRPALPAGWVRGFTLIELMVAISIMALMALMSWRGLEHMGRAQNQLQQRADEVLALQAGLNQWGTDLDALVQLPNTPALDWDGRALRLVRKSAPQAGLAAGADTALQIVAWARRNEGSVVGGVGRVDAGGQWLRWQSQPLRTRGDLQTAWAMAAQWGQNPGDDLKRREVRVVPASQMQIFYFRADAWSNPLSSEGNAIAGKPDPAKPDTVKPDAALPDGIRLVLTLPAGQAVSGTITRDWVRPTVGGGKS